jgi:hypothetical protein
MSDHAHFNVDSAVQPYPIQRENVTLGLKTSYWGLDCPGSLGASSD